MFVEVRCVMFRLLCRVEEGTGQLGFVALGLVKAVVVCSVPLALVKLGFGSFSY